MKEIFTKSVFTDFISKNPIKTCFEVSFLHIYGQKRAKKGKKMAKVGFLKFESSLPMTIFTNIV